MDLRFRMLSLIAVLLAAFPLLAKDPVLVATVGVNYGAGFIDKTGAPVPGLTGFDKALDFSDGLGRVMKRVKVENIDRPVERWGFIDRNGQFVIPPQFDAEGRFSEGLAAVRINGAWGYIDRAGARVVEPKYAAAEEFSDGLAAVKNGNLWGFIDKTGAEVIPLTFDCPAVKPPHFSGGLARVFVKGHAAFIDKTGKTVLEWPDSAGNFHEGLAWTIDKGKFGYIDTTGKLIIPAQYTWAGDFSEGLAPVQQGDARYSYIDKTGAVVIPGAAIQRAPRWIYRRAGERGGEGAVGRHGPHRPHDHPAAISHAAALS